jgi:hypothetical protein
MPKRRVNAIKPKASMIKFVGYAVAISGSAFIVWYLLLREREREDGRDLWDWLGYPYGPIGNLPAIGADFYSGLNQTDGKSSLPVLMKPGGLVARVLTDTFGVPLTDALGVQLTDVPVQEPSQLYSSRNAAGISSRYNYSGSKPS